VRRLHEAALKGLARQEVKDKIALQGMDATPSASPEAFDADIRAEAPMLERVVRESGAKVE
jgi:tripartite-type tricarboxylate transporter receptor subunit TctC